MFQSAALDTADKAHFYQELAQLAGGLFAGERNMIANAANLSALIFDQVPDLNWAGFYFFDGTELVVGPFQGKPACVRIPLGRGVCGAAASSRQTQRVADVHAVADHIACDAASRSELVVPLFKGERLIGVLDMDSPLPNRFDAEDQQGFEALAELFLQTVED